MDWRCLVLALLGTLIPWLAIAEPILDLNPAQPGRLILHVCNASGHPIRPLISDPNFRDQYDRQGTPDVSADGKRVAFDAWSLTLGESWRESAIVVVDFDGKDPKVVCRGVMPSFSPDGSRLVVSVPAVFGKPMGATGRGIWVMNADGENQELIADQGAWGGRWSADGRTLVFFGGVDDEGKRVQGNCLRRYDFQTGGITNIFEPKDSPFNSVGFHFDWAGGNSRTVAFAGTLKANGQQVSATIDIDRGLQSMRFLSDLSILHGSSFDFHPGGRHLLVTGRRDECSTPVCLPITRGVTPMRFPDLLSHVHYCDSVFTPDKKHLISSLSAGKQFQTAETELSFKPEPHGADNDPLEIDLPLDLDPSQPSRLIIHVCDLTGRPIRPLITDKAFLNRLDRHGSPDVSVDGSRIAFDAWSVKASEIWSDGRIVVVNRDGSDPRVLCRGSMPSFSPNGKRLACSRARQFSEEDGASGNAIWVVNVDGTGETLIADQYAWGVDWSGDGKSLIFYGGLDDQGNRVPGNHLRRYDMETGKTTDVFSAKNSPFQAIHHCMDCSEGKQQIVTFSGVTDQNEYFPATIDLKQGIDSLKIYPTKLAQGSMFQELHPSGDFMVATGMKDNRLAPVPISTNGKPLEIEFSGLLDDVIYRDTVYTPDGKHLLSALGTNEFFEPESIQKLKTKELQSAATTKRVRPQTLTTYEQTEDRIREIIKQRKQMVNADIEYSIAIPSDANSFLKRRVWMDGDKLRADTQSKSSEGTGNETQVVTPDYNWQKDLESGESNFHPSWTAADKKRSKEIAAELSDFRRFGVMAWWSRSIDQQTPEDDFFANDDTKVTVTVQQRQGKELTVVRLEDSNGDPTGGRREYWLSPECDNHPVYVSKTWYPDDALEQKIVMTQTNRWKEVEGVWFPESLELAYKQDGKPDWVSRVKVRSVKFDVDIPESLFERPPNE